MVSSVVSNPSERLVTHRVDADVESAEETQASRKSSSSSFLKRLLVFVVFLFFLFGVSLLSYFLVTKYKSLAKFQGRLTEYLKTEHPAMNKAAYDKCFKNLSSFYSARLITEDPKFEYEIYREFENFNLKYKKEDKNDRKRQKRFAVFRSNYLEVKAQKGDEPYLKAITRFSDLTDEEFYKLFPPIKVPNYTRLPHSSMYLDLVENKTYLKNLKLAKNSKVDVDPSSVTGEDLDWRRANCLSSVKDQMECGGCWAFASVGSVESFYLTHKDVSYDLSTQELIDCEYHSFGCFGGSAESALTYVKDHGLVSSSTYPYVGLTNKCSVPPAKRVYISTFFIYKGSEIYKKSLKVSPTVVSIAVSPEFSKYKSGVYTGRCGNTVNHDVLLVGEGYDEKLDKRYWIVKNSWGTDWGENGYVRLERTGTGVDKCGILDTGYCPFVYSG